MMTSLSEENGLNPKEQQIADKYMYWDQRVRVAEKEYNDLVKTTQVGSHERQRAYSNVRRSRRWARYWANRMTMRILEHLARNQDG